MNRPWRFQRTAYAALLGALLAASTAGLSLSGQSTPPVLPDPKLTPGNALDVTREDICRAGYTKLVRNVPKHVKDEVYREYGIVKHHPREFEIDHLISLELGGSNSIKNLWPESYETHPWNAHVKDRLENELHREICSGAIEIGTAQQCIARDWIACYKQTFHTGSADMPRRHGANGSTMAPGSGERTAAESKEVLAPRVWVNTRSGKYFLPGSRYFGQTKEGTYLSEAEAIRRGYIRAKNARR